MQILWLKRKSYDRPQTSNCARWYRRPAKLTDIMFRLQPAKIWNTTRYIYKNYGTWGILFHSKTQTKMKKETFEQFLERLCFDINTTVLDDDMPDFFDNWLANVEMEDMMRWGQMYGESQYVEGMGQIVNQLQ